jgi:hypothetical protein
MFPAAVFLFCVGINTFSMLCSSLSFGEIPEPGYTTNTHTLVGGIAIIEKSVDIWELCCV